MAVHRQSIQLAIGTTDDLYTSIGYICQYVESIMPVTDIDIFINVADNRQRTDDIQSFDIRFDSIGMTTFEIEWMEPKRMYGMIIFETIIDGVTINN